MKIKIPKNYMLVKKVTPEKKKEYAERYQFIAIHKEDYEEIKRDLARRETKGRKITQASYIHELLECIKRGK